MVSGVLFEKVVRRPAGQSAFRDILNFYTPQYGTYVVVELVAVYFLSVNFFSDSLLLFEIAGRRYLSLPGN